MNVNRKLKVSVSAFYILAITGLYAVIGGSALMYPYIDHGDYYSDANVMATGATFMSLGPSPTLGMPVFDRALVGRTGCTVPGEGCGYTHYPPGPEWAHYLFRLMGFNSLVEFRFITMFLSISLTILIPSFFYLATGRFLTAIMSSLFYFFSKPFIEYADTLYNYVYVQIIIFSFMVLWLIYCRSADRHAVSYFFCAWLLFFLNCWFTFETILFLGIFCVGSLFIYGKFFKRFLPLCIMAIAPMSALAGRFFYNSLYFGDWRTAYADIFGAAGQRVGASLADAFFKLFRMLGTAPPNSLEAQYNLPLFPLMAVIAGFLSVLVWASARFGKSISIDFGSRGAFRWIVLLWLCGSSWYAFMPQHAVVHSHLVLWLLPGFALTMGAMSTVFKDFAMAILRNYKSRPKTATVLGGLLFVLLLGSGWVLYSYVLSSRAAIKVVGKPRAVHSYRANSIFLDEIAFFGSSLSAEVFPYVDFTDRPVAFHLGTKFGLLRGNGMCVPGNDASEHVFLVNPSRTRGKIIGDCVARYGMPSKISHILAFSSARRKWEEKALLIRTKSDFGIAALFVGRDEVRGRVDLIFVSGPVEVGQFELYVNMISQSGEILRKDRGLFWGFETERGANGISAISFPIAAYSASAYLDISLFNRQRKKYEIMRFDDSDADKVRLRSADIFNF